MQRVGTIQDRPDRGHPVAPLHTITHDQASGTAPEATHPTEAGKASA
jgi:hypothetical protein